MGVEEVALLRRGAAKEEEVFFGDGLGFAGGVEHWDPDLGFGGFVAVFGG